MSLDEQIQAAAARNDWDEVERLSALAMAEDAEDSEQSESETDTETEEQEVDIASEGSTEEQGETDDGQQAETQGEQEAATSNESEESAEVAADSQSVEFDESKITFDENGNAVIPKEMLSVVAKDGKHHLPYGVLEGSRSRAKELAEQLNQEKQLRAEAESKLGKSDRLTEGLKKQLEKNGIDPEELPEDIQITDELLASLDDYGEVGKILKSVIAKQNQVAQTKEAPQESTQPAASSNSSGEGQKELSSYLQKNPEFAEIFQKGEGDDQFETIDLFYRQVLKDPEFNGKPLSDKLDAAMERFHKVYPGKSETATDSANPIIEDSNAQDSEAIAAAAQAKLKEAQENAVPPSPSEVGNPAGEQKSNVEIALGLEGQALLNHMEQMSPEELDELQSKCMY